jgi:hypothetical protein
MSLKRRLTFTGLHVVIFQKMELFRDHRSDNLKFNNYFGFVFIPHFIDFTAKFGGLLNYSFFKPSANYTTEFYILLSHT